MKKIITLGLLLATAVGVQAASFQVRDFINGNNIRYTNNTTITFQGQNIPYVGTPGSNYLWSATSSNQPVTWVSGTAYYTNTAVLNTNVQNNYAWKDLPIYADALGNYGKVRLSVTAALDGVAATNVYTLVFQAIPYDLSKAPNELLEPDNVNQQSTITIRLPLTGLTNMTYTTNLTQAQVEGFAGYRLVSVANANSTTNALGYLRRITLGGWVP